VVYTDESSPGGIRFGVDIAPKVGSFFDNHREPGFFRKRIKHYGGKSFFF
jgi:hypothetical protein